MDHEYFMKMAIERSQKGMQQNIGGPFGAVIVKDGEVVGKGQNQVTSTNDPTAHAEVVAIRDACKRVNNFSLEDAILYTSCEPCPMCLAACYWARIKKIYYGNSQQDAASIDFDDAFLYKELTLPHESRSLEIIQICRDEAYKVFEEWRIKSDKTPY
jgi:guanine deaminase